MNKAREEAATQYRHFRQHTFMDDKGRTRHAYREAFFFWRLMQPMWVHVTFAAVVGISIGLLVATIT